MKLVTYFCPTHTYVWGDKSRDKHPLKEGSKHKYNGHAHPHKDKQELSLSL